MKKYLFFLCLFIFLGCQKDKNNLEGDLNDGNPLDQYQELDCKTDVYLNFQDDIENFNCETVKGNLYIGLLDYPSLEISEHHFYSLETVERNLVIYNIEKFDEDSFGNLKQVGGLTISYSDKLTSIGRFNSLTNVLGSINIFSNKILGSFDGFNTLKEISGSLSISVNESLESITGFNNLEKINTLNIGGNDNLKSVGGLNNLKEIYEDLNIRSNESLVAVDGFNDLTVLGGLNISDNLNLKNINGFNKIEKISKNGITISDNINLTNIVGFNNLSEIHDGSDLRGLTVQGNKNLFCEELCKFYNKVISENYNILGGCESFDKLKSVCE